MYEITIKANDVAELNAAVLNLAEKLGFKPEAPAASTQAAAPAPYVPVAQMTEPLKPNTEVLRAATGQAPANAAVPTTGAPVYTLEQLAVAATPLSDAGRQQELVALLNQFGVHALTQLPKEQYGAFATALRGMGAKI